MLCTCFDKKISYVLGDLGLLCCERKKSATNANLEDWRMTQHDPAGTVEMKPPEVYIKSNVMYKVYVCVIHA